MTWFQMPITSLYNFFNLCFPTIRRNDQQLLSKFVLNIRVLKHDYFTSLNKQTDPTYDPKNETKFSFYEKESIIDIPKNIKVENPK